MGLEKLHIGKFYLKQPEEEADFVLEPGRTETTFPDFDQDELNTELDLVLWGIHKSRSVNEFND